MHDNSNKDDQRKNNNTNVNYSLASRRDPYKVLNLSRNATELDIQRAYKRGSRALHPDKQTASAAFIGSAVSDAASQENFLILKEAYDILSDPSLRQAYDMNGYTGVNFVRGSITHGNRPGKISASRGGDAAVDATLYTTLSSLYTAGKANVAAKVLREAIEYYQYKQFMQRFPTHATIQLACATTNSRLFGEGTEPVTLPEVTKVNMAVETTILPFPSRQQAMSTTGTAHDKWSVTLGVNTSAKNGVGSSNGSVRVECEVQPGTAVIAGVEVGDDSKVALSSTRVLTNGTSVTTGISTMSLSRRAPLVVSVSSQRMLWGDMLNGGFAVGMGSNRQLHYLQLALTSFVEEWPRVRAALNLGGDPYIVKVSAEHTFARDHRGSMSIGVNPVGRFELKLASIREVSKYIDFGIGLRHATFEGLSVFFQLERGDMALKVPITLSKGLDASYPFKVLYVGLWWFLVDAAVGDIASDAREALRTETAEKEQEVRDIEERSLRREKQRKEAERQLSLLSRAAIKKRELEESKNGLVIINATYFTDASQTSDVTEQLQFWVKDSTLRLPGGCSKASFMGFYDLQGRDVDQDSDNKMSNTSFSWERLLSLICFWRHPHDQKPVAVQLYVRYRIGTGLYELTVKDKDPLILPNGRALRIGDWTLVQ